MVDSARARRLSKRIVAIVATELEHQVKDPRLAMLTVTGATVTPDLRDAVVYYTVYGDDDDVQATGLALASATGVLRTAVGRQTGIKFTPTLSFKLDAVPENASRIDDLLAAAQAADAAVAQQAASAQYAGEPDPYRVPRVEPEDEDDSDEGDPSDEADTDPGDTDLDDTDPGDTDLDDTGLDDAGGEGTRERGEPDGRSARGSVTGVGSPAGPDRN
ncbi:30S ribosome-binding factor RbfA [Nakamurella flavida]|uniref:Ribosome-binding factor A n=1 Tax=Nakamurella flavida TaxID=363630 RepID=A0A938YHV8_9ACTN|nr:30S ribosome-binding factor RbfA [Nakamurella flavida]MBM9475038.1 30S ribosome-binding factor RbfA [Nakamurella flavida]MDP9776606.1 ribosome-binding factor A [Nakamurella flavida]